MLLGETQPKIKRDHSFASVWCICQYMVQIKKQFFLTSAYLFGYFSRGIQQLYSISYLLYTPFGTVTTMVVGMMVSLITGKSFTIQNWDTSQENLRGHVSRLMSKPTKWLCARRRLRSAWASVQSDKSSLCAHWVPKDPRFLHADS